MNVKSAIVVKFESSFHPDADFQTGFFEKNSVFADKPCYYCIFLLAKLQ